LSTFICVKMGIGHRSCFLAVFSSDKPKIPEMHYNVLSFPEMLQIHQQEKGAALALCHHPSPLTGERRMAPTGKGSAKSIKQIPAVALSI
jgi:hypothetical protein